MVPDFPRSSGDNSYHRFAPANPAAWQKDFARRSIPNLERLASYKVPARLAFRTAAELPRTPTGKIHKPTLSDELAANTAI
jgi:acyl-CoA synthetase (AMP-forming)/AMP-acid ligase II